MYYPWLKKENIKKELDIVDTEGVIEEQLEMDEYADIPTEKEYYAQLSPEEKKEWDTLDQLDRDFYLVMESEKGREMIFGKLDSIEKKIGELRLFGI